MAGKPTKTTPPSREFQVFAKPVGAICNLACVYCYYLEKEKIYPAGKTLRMNDEVLEEYVVQQIEATTDPVIFFSWHGGEPTLFGLDSFRTIVHFQRKHKPPDKEIVNGIQTNGTLLNEAWCEFFAAEHFIVGISIDGPEEIHNRYRLTKDKRPTFKQTIRGYDLLQKYRVHTEILCVVNDCNVKDPLAVYHFFKQLNARYITFLPLVEQHPDFEIGVTPETVPACAFGDFLCTIFDEWESRDIGKIKIQIIEEATRTAFNQEHTLCIFKKRCGGVPVVEHNGDFYSCDHFVDPDHLLGNIRDRSLAEFLDSPEQKAFGQAKLDTLPRYCRHCEVLDMCNGECPKNRFIRTPDGEAGLNYLCEGYKKFFTHCQPFVNEVAAQWQRQLDEQQRSVQQPNPVGRNDPCPCGSGKKYKNCCMRNE